MKDDEFLKASDFWMKAAAYSFGAWAVLLSLLGWIVSRSVDAILKSDEETRQEFKTFTVMMEHRVTALEEENIRDSARLQKLENSLHEHERSGK